MRFIKNHLGLILPLFAILFALEYMRVMDRSLQTYETRLKDQYTVLVVADAGTDPVDLRNADVLVADARRIDASEVLARVRGKIGRESLAKLEAALPAFYSLSLRHYPDARRLQTLKERLSGVKGVKRVLVFEKVHDRLFELLLFAKTNFYVFGGLLGLVGFLLVLKQMALWQLEHSERMQIMALFGAPVWLRSGVLIRLAIVDTLVALGLVALLFLYLPEEPHVASVLEGLGLASHTLFRTEDLALLAATGFGVSLFCALWVILRFKEEL